MKSKPLLIAMALAVAGTAVPVAAQSAYPQSGRYYNDNQSSTFWRGAPDGLSQRIDWLQQRIERGVSDGSLSRQEARRAQAQLDILRRDASVLQQRLDSLSTGIQWARNNGNGYGNGNGNGAYNNNGYATRDPYATDYDAYRYYRDDPRYQERRLTMNDEVYRGSDGRYYCKRSDGTTGLVIGGVGGAVVGNVIDGGRNRVAGTLIGGALGALLGQQVDRNASNSNDVRCR